MSMTSVEARRRATLTEDCSPLIGWNHWAKNSYRLLRCNLAKVANIREENWRRRKNKLDRRVTLDGVQWAFESTNVTSMLDQGNSSLIILAEREKRKQWNGMAQRQNKTRLWCNVSTRENLRLTGATCQMCDRELFVTIRWTFSPVPKFGSAKIETRTTIDERTSEKKVLTGGNECKVWKILMNRSFWNESKASWAAESWVDVLIRAAEDCTRRRTANVENRRSDGRIESADLGEDTGLSAKRRSFVRSTFQRLATTTKFTRRCSSSLVLPMYIIVSGDKRIDA